MSKKVSSVVSVLLVLILTLTLSACQAKGTTEMTSAATTAATTADATTQKPLDPVNLVWYMCGDPQPGLQRVVDELNKTIQAKINATLKIVIEDWGSYDEKMQMLMASGTEFDLCFTSDWCNQYFQKTAKGAFLPIDDLLNTYGKDILAHVPERYWPGVKVKGKTYGVINYQIMAIIRGLMLRTDLVTKYGFDAASVKSMADLEPFFAAVKKGEPQIKTICGPYKSIHTNIGDLKTGYKYAEITTVSNGPFYIKADDKDMNIINFYETPDVKAYYGLMRSWYQKGYFPKDVVNMEISDYNAQKKAGEVASFYVGLSPDADTPEWTPVPLMPAITDTNANINSMTAISKTSKNPERAMMLLNMVFSDKEFFNTLVYGIEGTDYNKLPDGSVDIVPNSGYSWYYWEAGPTFNAYIPKGIPLDCWEKTKAINDSAALSPLVGFCVNQDPIKTPLTQIAAVIKEYAPGLSVGAVDPSKRLPEFNAKLKAAGFDAIAAELKKQIDEWNATK